MTRSEEGERLHSHPTRLRYQGPGFLHISGCTIRPRAGITPEPSPLCRVPPGKPTAEPLGPENYPRNLARPVRNPHANPRRVCTSRGEMRAFFLNLLMFKKQLMSTPSERLILADNDYILYQVSRTPDNGVSLSIL